MDSQSRTSQNAKDYYNVPIRVSRASLKTATGAESRQVSGVLEPKIPLEPNLVGMRGRTVLVVLPGSTCNEMLEEDAQEWLVTVKGRLLDSPTGLVVARNPEGPKGITWRRVAPLEATSTVAHDAIPVSPVAPVGLSSGVATAPAPARSSWHGRLSGRGLALTSTVADSFLIATLAAWHAGSLVLLNGPVGVGKTSLVERAARVFGGDSTVVPVRPSWLDPADLLGFFDPLNEIFRPTPFLSALHTAQNTPERLHIVCLDELNLARIENYGADVLSRLEYARGNAPEKAVLQLYAEDIHDDLVDEARELASEGDGLDSAGRRRLRKLARMLERFPARFPLPPNLVMVGTLNADATTYELSPKVIDRSYVITFPPARFNEPLSAALAEAKGWNFVQDPLVTPDIEELPGWKTLFDWNERYLANLNHPLGLPLGHRIQRDYKVTVAAGRRLGFSESDCLGHFIFTKVLPRLRFFKNQGTQDDPAVALCSEWLEALMAYEDYAPDGLLNRLHRQLADGHQRVVHYWA
jgi:hypothetical protein